MRMKEFYIQKYGPLSYKQPIVLDRFNLFFGNNEEGKTLSIDALVKLLFGRKGVKGFKRIDRVDQSPEGWVVLESINGDEIKLPEKGDITGAMGLTQSECSNIFIIRNSELSISRENDFYADVTDRLTGLRTNEIEKIKESLLETARVTPGWIFRDVKEEKLKSRLDEAAELIERVEYLKKGMAQAGFDELAERMVEYSETIQRIELEIGNFEDARKRKIYETGHNTLEKIEEASRRLTGLEKYNENDGQIWRDSSRYIENYYEEKTVVTKKIKENEDKMEGVQKRFNEKSNSLRILDERKKALDNEVRPMLRNFEEKARDVSGNKEKNRFFTLMVIIFSALCGIALGSLVFRPGVVFLVTTIFFILCAFISAVFKLQFLRKKSWLASELKSINLLLSRFNMQAEHIEGIEAGIQEFQEQYNSVSDEVDSVNTQLKILESSIRSFREERLQSITDKIECEEKKIDSIRRKSGLISLEEYAEKVALKRDLLSELGKQQNLLKEFFSNKDFNDLSDAIPYWKGEVEKLKEYKHAVLVEFDEDGLSLLKREKESALQDLNGVETKLNQFQQELEGIEREINTVLRLNAEYLHCNTSVDLEAVKQRLDAFINSCEERRENSREVQRIFEEIERQEREKVTELFGKDSCVSKYFDWITAGSYNQVVYNQDELHIEVCRKNRKVLGADKLSSGAYDQLYLSIRLALGEKLLADQKGFFILDDPFIKSDPERLQRQFKTLLQITELGWQILYFSAKGEVRDIAHAEMGKNVKFIELPGIFSDEVYNL